MTRFDLLQSADREPREFWILPPMTDEEFARHFPNDARQRREEHARARARQAAAKRGADGWQRHLAAHLAVVELRGAPLRDALLQGARAQHRPGALPRARGLPRASRGRRRLRESNRLRLARPHRVAMTAWERLKMRLLATS